MPVHKSVTALIILDGFGWRTETKYNAIAQADTPHFDQWMKEYPYALLKASGTAVGLPKGYIGNSEVGHLTIGAGRIIKSPITMINEVIDSLSFFSNPALLNMLERVKEAHGTLHIMGMLSTAGVHADLKHLYAFLKSAHNFGIKKIVVHAFLDGRDSLPREAKTFLQKVEKKLKPVGAVIASIHGRAYAMDRDKNWEKTEESYRILTEPQEKKFSHWQDALTHYYEKDITDEFIPPTQLTNDTIKDGDGIIFFNFRPDRARQLSASFVDPHFDGFTIKNIALSGFVTPTAYDAQVRTDTMYPSYHITHTLTHTLAEHNKTIFTIAETEKYAHITYFFNGGREEPERTETRILIPTLDDKTSDRSPCMAAKEITETVIASLQQNPCDFYLINYANADIIGHTGDFEKTVTAVEYLDRQLECLYEQIVEKMNGTMFVTADHGNAEDMYDEKAQQPRTAHTTHPVPFLWIVQKEKGNNKELPLRQLCDIAPFILKHMGIPIPKEMHD